MKITMISSELCEMLNVSKEGLRGIIKRKTLERRLEDNGYKLLSKTKSGRDNIYELEVLDKDPWEDYQNYRRIKKKEEHTTYVENRITDGLQVPRRKFLKELSLDISETTAGRYDKMLIEDKIMQKDKEVFLLYNQNEGSFTEITEEEYKNYWRNSSECTYQLRNNYLRFVRGDIPESTYESNKYLFMNELGNEKGVVALKYHTYKEYLNTKEALEMIRKHREKKNK